MSRKEGFLTAIGLLLVIILFGWVLTTEEEPAERLPETDEITGSIVWKATSTPTTTCTTAPTATGTPEPTATQEPTATPEPTATNTPAAVIKRKAGYHPGVPGTYLAEANGTHRFKPWTGYRAYTLKSSPQYRLQQIAYSDENGLRMVADPEGCERYCIALGTTWAGGTPNDIGRCVNIYMQDGSILRCVLADVKKVEDTLDCEGLYGLNGDLIEFIVDREKLAASVKRSGTVSSLGGAFAGEGIEVDVLDLYIDGFGG